METKKGINKYSQQILSNQDLINILLQGKSINKAVVIPSEDIDLFTQHQFELLDAHIHLKSPCENLSCDEFHKISANTWNFPIEYQNIDVLDFLAQKCTTEEQIQRMYHEYQLYEERNLIMLLRLFIYLVDYMRSNKYIWGVGRGSAVSSYILFLIGVHKVDSIKYNLPIEDYLK